MLVTAIYSMLTLRNSLPEILLISISWLEGHRENYKISLHFLFTSKICHKFAISDIKNTIYLHVPMLLEIFSILFF